MITVIVENIFMLIMRKFLMAVLALGVLLIVLSRRKEKGCSLVPEMKLDLEERFVQGQSEDWDRTETNSALPSASACLAWPECLLINFSTTAGAGGDDWQDNWELSEKILYSEAVRINRFGINQWIISHCEFRKWHISSTPTRAVQAGAHCLKLNS